LPLDEMLMVGRSQPSGARNQAAALRNEGVIVTTGALGELMVDLEQYGWFPHTLPSDAQRQSEDEDSNEED
jgi:methylated-DNA-protein-cysteine methyltransferase related protein